MTVFSPRRLLRPLVAASLLFLGSLPLSAERLDSLRALVVGEWVRTLQSEDAYSGTHETQRLTRNFAADGSLSETIFYDERVLTDEGEVIVLTFKASVSGNWELLWRRGDDSSPALSSDSLFADILVYYRLPSLRVSYVGVDFPERAAALRSELQRSFERSDSEQLRNYRESMKRILRSYYKKNNGAAFRRVEVNDVILTAVLGDEVVTFTRP